MTPEFKPGDRVHAYVEDWTGAWWEIGTLVEYGAVSVVQTDDGHRHMVIQPPDRAPRIRKIEEVFP